MELLPRKTFRERPLERVDWRTVYFGKDYVGTAAPGRPRSSSAESGPCHLPLETMKFGESAKIFRVCRDDCDTAPSRAGCDQRVIGQAASPDLFVIVFEGQPVQ